MIDLYGYYPSGNSYKIELLLTQLKRAYRFIHLDILKGETRTPEFLKKNPNGRIPVVKLSEERYLAESNAILMVLGEGSLLFPKDPWIRGQIYQWLFFEQYHVEATIGVARFHLTILKKPLAEVASLVSKKQEEAQKALLLMDDHLKDRAFFVHETYSLADIALYAYSHLAEAGGISLGPYIHLQRWFERVRKQKDHIPMTL